jgi:hypothetical protein
MIWKTKIKDKSKPNWIQNFAHKLSDMLSGHDGYWSAMRWLTVTTTNTIILVWTIISIANWKLQPIPESVVTIFGIAVAGKWAQKKDEAKENIAGVDTQTQPPTIIQPQTVIEGTQ